MAESLAGLLLRWATEPTAELGDAIVEAGLAAPAPPQLAWEPTVVPEAVSALLAALTSTGAAKARGRVAAVAHWPADPRVDRWVAQAYLEPPWTSTGARVFWTALQPLTVRIRDPRAVQTLRTARKLGKKPWQQYLAGQLDKALASIGAIAPPAAQSQKPLKRGVSIDALIDAALATPQADEPRLVLADALQEAGRPWGELISLQVNGGDAKRIKALIKAAAVDVLGPLAPVVKPNFVVTRGFVSKVTLKGVSSNASKLALQKVVGHPRWSTVESLEGPNDAEVAAHPVMVSLRGLINTRVPLSKLAKLERLEQLDVSSLHLDVDREPRGAFPALKHLTLRAGFSLQGWSVIDRLETLVAVQRLVTDEELTPKTVRDSVSSVARTPRAHTSLFVTRGDDRDDPGTELVFDWSTKSLQVAVRIEGNSRQNDEPTFSAYDRPRMLADLEAVMDALALLRPSKVEFSHTGLPPEAARRAEATVARAGL